MLLKNPWIGFWIHAKRTTGTDVKSLVAGESARAVVPHAYPRSRRFSAKRPIRVAGRGNLTRETAPSRPQRHPLVFPRPLHVSHFLGSPHISLRFQHPLPIPGFALRASAGWPTGPIDSPADRAPRASGERTTAGSKEMRYGHRQNIWLLVAGAISIGTR